MGRQDGARVKLGRCEAQLVRAFLEQYLKVEAWTFVATADPTISSRSCCGRMLRRRQ